jgi:hypothetical protein
MQATITNAMDIRKLANDPRLVSTEHRKAEASDHKFKAGDVCILTGLEEFSEYNDDRVTVTAVREDGPHGKAYYVKGRINEMLNWVYEYRLRLIEPVNAKATYGYIFDTDRDPV